MSDLRGFLRELDSQGLLLHIGELLSTRFEIAAVMKHLDGRPLLFERVEGYRHRVAAGLCSSRGLIQRALGVEGVQLYERLLQAVRNPRRCEVGDGPVKERVVDRPKLSQLPIL